MTGMTQTHVTVKDGVEGLVALVGLVDSVLLLVEFAVVLTFAVFCISTKP